MYKMDVLQVTTVTFGIRISVLSLCIGTFQNLKCVLAREHHAICEK